VIWQPTLNLRLLVTHDGTEANPTRQKLQQQWLAKESGQREWRDVMVVDGETGEVLTDPEAEPVAKPPEKKREEMF
jgi:hypothetical protein